MRTTAGGRSALPPPRGGRSPGRFFSSRPCRARFRASWWLALATAVVLFSPPQIASPQSWPRHVVDRSSCGADGVRLADVNGDGLLDIATAWEEGGLVRVYVHPGPARVRQPWPAVTVGKTESPEDAVLVDLDADGAMDVVSCCEGRNRSVYVHWAPTDPARYYDPSAWRTEPIPCTRGVQMWMFALPLRVDSQHGVDLVIGSKGEAASVSWLQSPARPRDLTRWQLHRLCDAGWVMSLCACDMDRDGDLDIVVSDRKGNQRGILWLENPGRQETPRLTSWHAHRLDAGDREVMFLTLAEFDSGTGQEVFCAVRGRGISHLWRRFPAGPWSVEEIPMPPNCGTGKAVAVGDIDGDGRKDLVFSCENAHGELSGVRWMSRNGASPITWIDHEISGAAGTKFDLVELLDLDADGDLDVVTCEESENLGVVWYENPSPPPPVALPRRKGRSSWFSGP